MADLVPVKLDLQRLDRGAFDTPLVDVEGRAWDCMLCHNSGDIVLNHPSSVLSDRF